MSRTVGSGQFGTVDTIVDRSGKVRKTHMATMEPVPANDTDDQRDQRIVAQYKATKFNYEHEVMGLYAASQYDNEVQGLRCHPNLVCAVDQNDEDHTIDMLRAPGKQLTELLDPLRRAQTPTRYFADWRTWLIMSYQLMEAVAFLHSHDVVHRDIKTANLMWDEATQHLTLVDMGFACMTTNCENIAGTGGFMAPEVVALMKRPDDTAILNLKAADMYSLGITLLDTLGFTIMDDEKVVQRPQADVITEEMERLRTAGVPDIVRNLIVTLLNPDSTRRKTIQDVKSTLVTALDKLTPRRFTSDITVSEEEAKTYVNQGPLCHPHLPCRDGTQIRRQPGRSLDDQVLANPRYVFYQLLEAVQWLHSKHQAHHELITPYIFWDPQTAVLQLLPIPAPHAPRPCKEECLTDDIVALKKLQNDYFKIPDVQWNTLAEGLEALCRTPAVVTTVARAPSGGAQRVGLLDTTRHTARGHDVGSAFPLHEETVRALRALKGESERLLRELVPDDDADKATRRKAELALGKWIYATYISIGGYLPHELSTSQVVQALRDAYTPGALPKDVTNDDIKSIETELEKYFGVAELPPRTRTFFATLAQQCWAAVLTASPKIELRFPQHGTTLDAAWMIPSTACDAKGPLVDGTAFPAIFVGDAVASKAVVWRKTA